VQLSFELRGVQAKAVYPPRSEGFTDFWAPHNDFAFVRARLPNAKSIG
jgi:hypothetical protein